MRKFAIFATLVMAAITVSGCIIETNDKISYSIDAGDIAVFQKSCAAHKGIEEIEFRPSNSTIIITCGDSTKFKGDFQ